MARNCEKMESNLITLVGKFLIQEKEETCSPYCPQTMAGCWNRFSFAHTQAFTEIDKDKICLQIDPCTKTSAETLKRFVYPASIYITTGNRNNLAQF